MKTTYRTAVAVAGMLTLCSATAAGVNQDKIPELQRDGRDALDATITGCVARGAAAGTYILTSLPKAGEAAAIDPVRTTVLLSGGADIDLGKHLGHSVSVTGSYAREWAMAFVAAEKAAPGEAGDGGGRKTARTFTAKSLKVVAESCSQSTGPQPPAATAA